MNDQTRVFTAALIASVCGALTAEGSTITLNACRPKGTNQDFAGRALEVSAETQGVTCGVVPHVLPAPLWIDGRNDIFFSFNGNPHYFGRATLLGDYQVHQNYKGPVLNECRLYEISPDAGVQVQQSEQASIPYPSVHIEGILLFPLPVLKRRLSATLEISLNDTAWARSSCVQDQIRLPRSEWEAVATDGDSDSPACDRFLQVLPDEYFHRTKRIDSEGRVTACANGILRAR
jgi:hypothetical protein